MYIYVPWISLSDFSRPLASLSSIARCECLTKRIRMPWMFAKHQGFSDDSYVRKERFSDIRIFANDFYTLKEHKVFPIVHISFPPFDERKTARNLPSLSSKCTRSRGMKFSILSDREWQSVCFSLSFTLFSPAEGAISFNFPTMRMRYGALRGFESANAANRYATSNSGSASESEQDNREKETEERERRGEGKEIEKLYIFALEKKTFLRIRENGGTGR